MPMSCREVLFILAVLLVGISTARLTEVTNGLATNPPTATSASTKATAAGSPAPPDPDRRRSRGLASPSARNRPIPLDAFLGASLGACPLCPLGDDIHNPLRDNNDLFGGLAIQRPYYRIQR